jgi:hypothetical protein
VRDDDLGTLDSGSDPGDHGGVVLPPGETLATHVSRRERAVVLAPDGRPRDLAEARVDMNQANDLLGRLPRLRLVAGDHARAARQPRRELAGGGTAGRAEVPVVVRDGRIELRHRMPDEDH